MNDPFRRPNGRPQACEPCRKRKVSCDHTHPVCRRCIKRKQQTDCIYIPQDSTRRPPPKPRKAVSSSAVPLAILPVSPSSSGKDSPVSRRLDVREEPTPVATATGYFGSTSFCFFYKEAEQLLQEAHAPESQSGDPDCGCYPKTPGLRFDEVKEKCLAVLSMIPDMTEGIDSFRKLGCSSNGVPAVLLLRIVKSICDTLGPYLASERDPQHLEAIARKLCHNTSKPLSDTEPDPERWIEQFIGDNLRWESFGVVFTLRQIETEPSLDEVGRKQKPTDLNKWPQISLQGLALTLELCLEFSKGSFMCLYFSQLLTVAESKFSGDASLRTWRRHADTVAMCSFLGYHAEVDTQPYTPTMISELRRRLYYWILNMGCGVAYFTGRPLLITSDYTTTPLPLDLSDEEIMNHAALQEAASKLDNGWKRNATRTNAGTFARARTSLGILRESMATIAIGQRKPASVDTLLNIKARVIETYENFPPLLKFNLKSLGAPNSLGDRTFFTQMLIRLEYLQILMFCERLILRHGNKEDRSELLAISFELIGATLPCWTHSDKIPAATDAEWLLMAFAAPAGGVLCHELLKPSFDLNLAFGTPGVPKAPYRLEDSIITRASIIQRLSLLVGFLDWVRPSAPNAEICCEARTVIQTALNQALNDPNPGTSGTDFTFTMAPEFSDWDFRTVLDFNCDLFDTFDWLRPQESAETE